MSPEERLTLRIDPELKRAAQGKAEAEDLTLSQVVRRLLRAWIRDDPLTEKESQDQD